MKKLSSLLASTLSFCLLLAPALAQRPSTSAPQQDTDDEVVRITTNLVQVDAVVTDSNGRHVTDLRPEDFEILEDGRKQEITNFSYVNVGADAKAQPAAINVARAEKGAPPIPPARLVPGRLRRTVALVVDDLSLSMESAHVVRKALKKYVDEQLQPGELSAILRTSSGVGVLQQFTSDKRLLNEAADRLRWHPRSRGGMSAVEPRNPLDILQEVNREGIDGEKGESTKETHQDNSVRDTIGTLMYIIRGFQSLPGRKAVVLFTDSLPIMRLGNRESHEERIRQLVDLANRSSVVFYTVDARGMQTHAPTAADDFSMPHVSAALRMGRVQAFHSAQDGMNYLARETGGIFFREQNDFNQGLQRMLDDQKGYYLIGYRPEASTFNPGKGRRPFRDLKVRVKRSGLSVRSRTGFYGVADSTTREQPRAMRQQLLDALSSPFGASGVDMRMAALFINDPMSGPAIRSIIHVSAGDLEFTKESDGRRKATIDVAAIIFASDGRPSIQGTDRREVVVSEQEYKRILKNGLSYRLNVPVRQPGAYQVRVAVRDTSSERTGSAREIVSVPDLRKGPLALSGVALAGVDPSRETTTAAEQLTGGAGLTLEVTDPGLSPAVRRLKHGVFLDYGYTIYNARLDKATGKPQLTTQVRLFRDGELVFTGGVTPLDISEQKDMKRLVAGGRLQVGTELSTGDYVLQVVVTDTLVGSKGEAARRTATQWVDFEIVK